MGIIDRIKKQIRGKSQTVPLTALPNSGGYRYFFQGLEGFSYNTRNAAEFTGQGFGRNPYVYAVVDKIAKVCANLPRCLQDDEGGEIPDTLQTREFYRLMDYPNYQGPMHDFYYRIFASLLVTGNAFIYIENPELFTTPPELLISLPEFVTIQTQGGREDGRPIAYSISPHGVFQKEYVLHIAFPNIIEATNWGLSPLYSGQAIYTASNNNFTAKAAVLKNRGISGILTPKNADMPITPNEQERLQKEWARRTAGPGKFGEIHVTTSALDFLDVGMSSKDLELVAHNIELMRDICRIYGVDSSLFGDPQNRTYSNQEQAVEALYRDVCLPLCEKVDMSLSKFLLPKFKIENAYWGAELEKVDILNKPQQDLSMKLIAEINAGIITAEEARNILYPEI